MRAGKSTLQVVVRKQGFRCFFNAAQLALRISWRSSLFVAFAALPCLGDPGTGAVNGSRSGSTKRIIFEPCAKWPTYVRGSVASLQAHGNCVYAAVMGGLVIYEIAPNGTLLQKGFLSLDGAAWSVFVQGDFAYVGLDPGGLAIVDVRHPERPKLAGRFTEVKSIQSLHVSGNLAFIPEAQDGVVVVNVSNPAVPAKVSDLRTGDYVHAVATLGGEVFLASRGKGLQIFNYHDPAAPRRLGEFKTRGLAIEVCVMGKYAYVLDGPDRLLILDVSDASKPVLVGSIKAIEQFYSHWNRIQVSENCVYLAGYSALDVVDVSDPGKPRLAKRMKRVGARTISSAGSWLIGGGRSTLSSYDISSPQNPLLRSSLPMFGCANDVEIHGHYAFLADGGGLQLLDVANPRAPVTVAKGETRGFAEGVRIAGNLAFVVDPYDPDGPPISETTPTFGLQIFDITDPTNLVKINRSSVATVNRFSRVAVTPGWAYLLDGSVTPVNLADLSRPRAERPISLGDWFGCKDICALSNHLYAVGAAGLKIFNLVHPARPELVGSYLPEKGRPDLLSGFSCLEVSWPYAYVAGPKGDVAILDVSVVSNPTVVGRCQCDLMPTGIAVSDHHLFLADEKGLKAFDVSKIDHPILEGEYPLEAPMKRIRVSGDFIFVCASRAFVILEMKFLSGK